MDWLLYNQVYQYSLFLSDFFKYIDKKGNLREDISWGEIIVDRMQGRIEDLLEHGNENIKDHDIDNYVKFLEKARL